MTGATKRRLRTLAIPAAFTLVMAGLLVGLGVWQLRRLAWKEALIARIEARTRAPAVALPPPAGWASIDPAAAEYTRVTARGTYLNEDETTILRASDRGPSFHVVTPLRLEGGGIALVDRGAVPPERRDAKTRPEGLITGETAVTGLMRAPEGRNPFTPADVPAENRFYTRDPAAIAAHFGLKDVAPFSIDADATPVPGGWPVGGGTAVDLPNNHLSYALTWFGLALGLLGVFAAFAWKRLREPSPALATAGGASA